MVLNDPIANMLSKIENAEKIGMNEVMIYPGSKLIKNILSLLQQEKYVGKIEEIVTEKGNAMKVDLNGNINKCRAIKPRHATKKDEYDKFEARYLPAKDFGVIIVSTSKGIMTHIKAKEEKAGGKLICYCY